MSFANHLVRTLPALFLGFTLPLFADASQAQSAQEGALSLELPKIILTGVPFAVGLKGDPEPGSNLELSVNGKRVGLAADADGWSGISINDSGDALIELLRAGQVVQTQVIPAIAGWISLLPPILAVFLAFSLRSVIPALFAGVFMGAWAVNGLSAYGAFTALFETITVYVLNTAVNADHMAIILFSLLIGGMVGIISRNGGMVGIVQRILPFANSKRRGQGVVASLGLVVFFDDYANTMIVGNATRPMCDKLKISREKLAYLVDSTAAPVATIAVVTTWIGFQVGLIQDAIAGIAGITQPAYALFLYSIPYSFYPFLAIFFVFVIVFTQRDFGPMAKAELKASKKNPDSKDSKLAESSQDIIGEFAEKLGIECKARNALLPIITLVGGVVVGIYISGEGDTVQDILGSANSYVVLMWASLSSCLVAGALSLGKKSLSLNEVVDAWMSGAKFMMNGITLLILAWALADVAAVLQTAPYLISILGDNLSVATLPALIFVLSAVAAFATGSSWGVMAILMPLVIPLCWAVMLSNGVADLEHMHILYSCIACVLTGSVWADHCSPMSDTTVLSSMATGCDHMQHVSTQMPYALLVGFVALLLGVLPVGFGIPWWLMLVVSAFTLVLIHHYIARPKIV